MASVTCPVCFKTTNYQYQKPKFCSACGIDIVLGHAPPQQVSVAQELRQMPPVQPSKGSYVPPPNALKPPYVPPPQYPNYPYYPAQTPQNYPAPPHLNDNYFDPYQADQTKEAWKHKLAGSIKPDQRAPRSMKLNDVIMTEHAVAPPETRSEQEVLAELARENGSIKSAPISLRDTSEDVRTSI